MWLFHCSQNQLGRLAYNPHKTAPTGLESPLLPRTSVRRPQDRVCALRRFGRSVQGQACLPIKDHARPVAQDAPAKPMLQGVKVRLRQLKSNDSKVDRHISHIMIMTDCRPSCTPLLRYVAASRSQQCRYEASLVTTVLLTSHRGLTRPSGINGLVRRANGESLHHLHGNDPARGI